MNFKFIKDILTNPDGLSYSSKRVCGILTLLATITYGFIYLLTKQSGFHLAIIRSASCGDGNPDQ